MRPHPRQCKYLLQLILHLQTRQSESGFAMVMVSILSVLLFSLLSAYLVFTNIFQASSTAFIDNNSSFYAAESGLNHRAEQIRQEFLGFAQPTGISPTNMTNCVTNNGNTGSADFACKTYTFNYREPNILQKGNLFIDSNQQKLPYIAYTYVQPNPKNLPSFPTLKQIPAGEPYAGLNAQEYSYRVYSTAIRPTNNTDVNSQLILQMDFNSRIIPLFQFMAFYQNDLEIDPGADMTLNGWVHTNGKLMLSPTAGVNLNLLGPVTAGGDIYNSLNFYNRPSGGGSIQFMDTSGVPYQDPGGNPLQLFAVNWGGPALTSSDLLPFGSFLQARVNQLQVPNPNFMSKVDPTQPGGIGEYYGKADLQLEFLPTQAVPFKVTAIKTGMTGGGCAGVTLSSKRQGSPLTCSVLNDGQLRSLQQPVLVQAETGTPQANFFCPNLATAQVGAPVIDVSRRPKVVRALQTAIVSQANPLPYSALSSNFTALAAVKNNFDTNLNAIPGLTSTEKTEILASTPEKVAAINNGCFIPAPIQAIQNSFYDQREGRTINLLQTNLRSLTAWNYYNIAVDWNGGAVTNTYSGQGNTIDELLFQRDAVDATAPVGSFRRLAAGTKSFGATDRSEGGLVIHATLDKSVYTYPARQSPYGFAITQGSTLPAPLTITSDQAIYLQGDYNNVGSQSAAVMGDTINVLSNACWDDTNGIKGSAVNECGRPTFGDQGIATETTMRTAFLARTNNTDASASEYSGGLNNYPRFLEDWQKTVKFNYTGSFVSLGTPQEFSGPFMAVNSAGLKYYMPPRRNWSYDTTFNQFDRLPPLSPRVIYLQQRVFKRDYE